MYGVVRESQATQNSAGCQKDSVRRNTLEGFTRSSQIKESIKEYEVSAKER